ncbi:F-actin capping protein alpha subunit-domain-containing protein [Neohortaea acidophila]|uniref:F-actin-capping protein subunit alpha n=1 Tax=Neohortaea acidophila TaxID=245834 RepID=A0A6A6Q0I6_9PEZI|nr:F-actin capping protein alpha subunit-domain-containing protein [Neohortaea acidophila]KAF2485496.1 F-actin capping protein alpha subunit-domain-containing protein [Neohortaea acidophila]
MASKQATVASFVESAPPGELSNVVADIKALADPSIVQSLDPAFKKYNEEQYTVVTLPGGSEPVLISEHNSLGDGRYFDTASQTSFEVDHASQKASGAQQHPLESQHADFIRSLQRSFTNATAEHFPSSTIGIFPVQSDSAIAILLVANKYSPQNFWNGRWRSTYIVNPSSSSASGEIKVDVHYYEDGNVRMSTSKKVELGGSNGADGIAREIAKAENRFQEELNRGFTSLSEGSFKGLRRQLPVTRQRVEWEKIGGYRLGQDNCGKEEIFHQQVEYLECKEYKDVDLDQDPFIVLNCGHVFTIRTLDGLMDMAKFYKMDENDLAIAIQAQRAPNLSEQELKCCPNCRGSLRNIGRYGRIVRRAQLN